ncbi:hypothetical protein pdam_00009306, partial [Pocillopora damicornis]
MGQDVLTADAFVACETRDSNIYQSFIVFGYYFKLAVRKRERRKTEHASQKAFVCRRLGCHEKQSA